jgi:hypothetical protein
MRSSAPMHEQRMRCARQIVEDTKAILKAFLSYALLHLATVSAGLGVLSYFALDILP